jgi:uroporphyrinogen-III synthase
LDDELIRDAETKNVSIDVIPFIKIGFISSEDIKHTIEKTLTIGAAIVFTSVNAVEAVAQKINEQKQNWKIFCIGHATKGSVEKHFGKKAIAGIADNAKELAKEIINEEISEVVFFCSDQRRDELPDLLKKNGVEIKEIVVYETVLTPKKIEKNYVGILFFSPSAVQSFFQKNKLNEQTVLFAIGNTTADEIKKNSKNKIVICESPDKKILIEKVINYFQTKLTHH